MSIDDRTFGCYSVAFTGRGWAVFDNQDWRCLTTPEPGEVGKERQIEIARRKAREEANE